MASSISIPITIKPIYRNTSATNLSKCQSPSQSPSSTQSVSLKRVVLYGIPFKNKDTISTLLQECIDDMSPERANEIIEKSENKSSISIITCTEKNAFRYCQNLVENGLDAHIE
jgi:hypothetical protein